MKGLPEDRAVQFARYIIEAGATVRETAKEFHISKSTVHKDIQERLPLLNYPLYREVRVVLDRNKEERHLRGGEATRRKYAARRAQQEQHENSYEHHNVDAAENSVHISPPIFPRTSSAPLRSGAALPEL